MNIESDDRPDHLDLQVEGWGESPTVARTGCCTPEAANHEPNSDSSTIRHGEEQVGSGRSVAC